MGYYKPYKGLFFSDMFFAVLGAGVTLTIPLIVRYITANVIILPGNQAMDIIVKLGILMVALVAVECFCNFLYCVFRPYHGGKDRARYAE